MSTLNIHRSASFSTLRFFVLPALALLLFAAAAGAQGASSTEERPGVTSGNLNIQQTFEFGYRWEDITGNRSVYNTFVNLNPGPRLFEQSLLMRSLDHKGALFDNFSLQSFGYGGDPNNATRLRMYKNDWYNLSITFRRDRNFWDYRLLANPLNPNTYSASVPAGTPFFLIPYSPHRMETTRRMTDYNLTIAPQRAVRARLGYSRNISEGPSLSTFHEGTDVFVFQDWKTTLNTYQVGVDFKMFPRTNISFDQFFHEFKGDTTWVDPVTLQTTMQGISLDEHSFLPRPIYQLSNGQPVDIGAIYNFTASQPCSSTSAAPFIINAATSPMTMKAACNGYLAYSRRGNIRHSYPVSQFSFQSSYFRNFDFSGRLVYSSSDGDILGSNVIPGYGGNVSFNGYSEFYQGLVTRTLQRQFSISGPVNNKRQSWTGDFAFTYHFTDNFRLEEQFRYDRWRIPGVFDMLELSLFPVNPTAPPPAASLLDAAAIFTPGTAPPANCPTPTSVGCPRHSTSSPADIASERFYRVLKQKTWFNQVELALDVTEHFGGHLGYRYRGRRIDEQDSESIVSVFFPTLPNRGGCTPGTTPAGFTATNLPDGSCRLVGTSGGGEDWTINEHTGVFGLWARPNDMWRLSYDMELTYADFSFTRISPRQRQRYKIRATFKPADWASISGHINLLEQRNNVEQIFHKQHYRTYAFAVSLAPDKSWAFDFGYDYNDVMSNTNICFTLTTTPLPPGSGPCPVTVPAQTTFAISNYDNKLNFAYFNVTWKPFKRLWTNLGYAISSTTGETLILGPINAPTGPLAFNWHKPYANIEIGLNDYVFVKSGWNFYGYNEKTPADVFTSPVDSLGRLVGRDFRGNLFTTSVKFVF
jgi:hypothetical protein